jgi:ribosomal protein L16 Arg81 hydroxylase
MSTDNENSVEFTYLNESDSANAHKNDEYKNVKLSGSDHLKEKVGALVKEFRDIFSTSISAEPARVTPLRFTIDREQWCSPANRVT